MSFARTRERDGDSLVAFVICLPLLVTLLLSSIDLWSIVAATTRCQNVANAGVRYVEDRADDYAPLQGTTAYTSNGTLYLSAADVKAAALHNGTLSSDQTVHRVSVSVSAQRVGSSSYTVTSWRDQTKSTGTRTVALSEVTVKAQQRVPMSCGILRLALGNEVTVTKTVKGQLPLEVVV